MNLITVQTKDAVLFLMNKLKRIFETPLFAIVVAVVLGYVCLEVPVPFVQGPSDLVLSVKLFALGVVLGVLDPRVWWRPPLFTTFWFVAKAFVDIIFNLESHNLLPIEFFIYGVATVIALAGAFVGRLIRNTKLRRS